MSNERFLFVVSGPSGAGKNSLVHRMIQCHGGIEEAISATTRPPRDGELDGTDYYFLTVPEFEACIAEGELLEYTKYVDNYYGTLKSEVEKRIEKGIVCVLVIEVEGAENIKKTYPGCTTIFVMPPSPDELERRLRHRQTESDARLEKRLRRADEEMALASQYDHVLVNDQLDMCAEGLYSIIENALGDKLR